MQMVEKFLFLWSQHQTDLPTQVEPSHVKPSALHSIPPVEQSIGAKKGRDENNVKSKRD